jgi:hypothetical protein
VTHQEALGVLHVLYLTAGLLATSIFLAAALVAVVVFAVLWRRRRDHTLRELAEWIRDEAGDQEETPGMPEGEAFAWRVHGDVLRDVSGKVELVADGKAWA